MKPKSLGEYEVIIQDLCPENVGVDLSRIDTRTFKKIWPLKDSDLSTLDHADVLIELNPLVAALVDEKHDYYHRPIWTKINVLDQAWNEYFGIGHFSFSDGWFDFIIKYLNYDRADQGGDTLFLIIQRDLDWALYFEYSVENSELTIEKYNK